MTEAIGWVSSITLVLTISKQVYEQWKTGSSDGVSEWLFIGQITASTGFTLYSIQVRNWVFVVTNVLMLVSAIIGGLIVLQHRRAGLRSARRVSEPRGTRAVHASAMRRSRGGGPWPVSPRGAQRRAGASRLLKSGGGSPADGPARPET